MAGEFSVKNTSAGESSPFLNEKLAHFGIAAVSERDLNAGGARETVRPFLEVRLGCWAL